MLHFNEIISLYHLSFHSENVKPNDTALVYEFLSKT